MLQQQQQQQQQQLHCMGTTCTLVSCADVISFSTALICLMCFVFHDSVYAGLGYLGAAMATSISLWLQFFTLLIYIVFLKVHCLGVNCAALLHGCQVQSL